MKLTFLGAAREVTGSRYFLQANGKNILIDYGMEQGFNVYENAPLPIPASAVDYVFLTHAHIDHSGWLPLLYKQGFRGQIFATEATADLCGIMLMDSAHIQEMETEWKNRKAMRSGGEKAEALYTTAHAAETLKLFVPCRYNQSISVSEGISILMVDVGHLLGSASIAVTVTEDGKTQSIAFSGDIGNVNQPLLRDPDYITSADYVVMESTYGDRTHGAVPDYVGEMVGILTDTFARGGNVVIPSFAVGRTQELLYFIRKIKQDGLVKNHPSFPVYIDSPLAIEATTIFNEHMYDCMDEETLALVKQGINPIQFEGLNTSVTADESKMINEDHTPKVIISASGMCDAGRIRHHLKHNLWRSDSTVLFVGYQSEGTLGRQLVDGADKVKLFGESITVSASIRRLSGISGHADQTGLLKWIGSFQNDVRRVFVTHGESDVAAGFAERLQSDLGRNATAPYNGETWDLDTDALLVEGNKVKLERRQPEESREEKQQAKAKPQSTPARTVQPENTAYTELVTATGRLNELVERMQDAPKKNQSKLAAALYGLLRKYGR